MKITVLYQVSHYIRVKKQRNIKSWDQQNYLVIRGFCYIRPRYNEVPLYQCLAGLIVCVFFLLNFSGCLHLPGEYDWHATGATSKKYNGTRKSGWTSRHMMLNCFKFKRTCKICKSQWTSVQFFSLYIDSMNRQWGIGNFGMVLKLYARIVIMTQNVFVISEEKKHPQEQSMCWGKTIVYCWPTMKWSMVYTDVAMCISVLYLPDMEGFACVLFKCQIIFFFQWGWRVMWETLWNEMLVQWNRILKRLDITKPSYNKTTLLVPALNFF